MDNVAVAGLTISTMVAAATLYDKVLPPAHQLVDQAPTAAAVGRVHRDCARTAPIALALGVGAAMLGKSWWPLAGVVVVVGWMCWQYDDAARAGTIPAMPATAATMKGRWA